MSAQPMAEAAAPASQAAALASQVAVLASEAAGLASQAADLAAQRRGQTRLWMVQRVTAAFLGLAVVVHLATIIWAVQGGLTAAEILARTRGNEAWLGFYALFALAAGLHGAIGLRNIAGEWLGWRGRRADLAFVVAGLLTALLGIRAAFGLYSA